MLEKIQDDISAFLQYFLFEIFDDITIKNMRHNIKNYLDPYLESYQVYFKVFSKSSLEMDITFDNNYLTFILTRNEHE